MPTTQIPRKKRRVAPSGRTGLHLRNRVPSTLAPIEAPAFEPVRVLALGIAVSFSFLLLILRLWYLQIAHGQEALDDAENNQRTSIRVVSPRGIIEDRKHEPLITNTSRIDVFIVPDRLDEWVRQEMRKIPRSKRGKGLRDRLETAAYQRLVDVLEDGTTVAELHATFKKNQQPSLSDPTPVKQDISQSQLARIAEGLADLPGVIPLSVPVRRYPKGKLAAQVLGYIKQVTPEGWKAERDARKKAASEGKDIDKLPDHRQTDYVGTYGLEKYYDDILSGEPGSTDYAVTAQGKRIKIVETKEAVPGARLTLTLDGQLQQTVENLMQGKKGAAVALDPRDGSVRAMFSFPTFDPTAFQRPITPEMVAGLNDGQNNRATSTKYPPGSTFKIVSSIAGLSEKKISRGTPITCVGSYKKKKCDGVHGTIALSSALTVSCDTYFYRVGELLGEDRLKTWCRNVGIGEKTGIDLSQDSMGRLSTSKAKAASFENQAKQYEAAGNKAKAESLRADAARGMNLGEIMMTGIGQGFTGVSPLQMAQVVSAVANGGKIYRPHLLDTAVAGDGSGRVIRKIKPELMHDIKLTREQWNAIRSGLRGAVTAGTARKTVSGSPFYIAGKTGTAELTKNGDNYAWFVCYASRKAGETPSIAVAVCLEPAIKGQHGGDVAAPIARRIVEAHFGMKGNDSLVLSASAGGD